MGANSQAQRLICFTASGMIKGRVGEVGPPHRTSRKVLIRILAVEIDFSSSVNFIFGDDHHEAFSEISLFPLRLI